MKTFAAVAALAAGIAIVGCAVHQQEAPGLSGPSQLANVLSLTATPDSISQNGGDQSTITITPIRPSGPVASGVPLPAAIPVNHLPPGLGTLSARDPSTH